MQANDYARLDAADQAYLDYDGGGLFALSQPRKHFTLLESGIFGNPLSHNPASRVMTRLVEHARAKVLAFLHASPQDYEVIFTANTSGALKLVGKAYPFSSWQPVSAYL